MAAPTQRANTEEPVIAIENGVTIEYKIGRTPSEKSKAHNAKTSLCREFALCSLKALVSEMDHPPFALDAVSATGLAGLQWKTRLGKEVHVTLAEREERALQQVAANAQRNGVEAVECPLHTGQVACYPEHAQTPLQVALARTDPGVLLLLHSFDFVYLDAHKNLASCFEALFKNVRHRGIVTVVVPDVSLFSRSAHVVSRHFEAYVIKTEYLKELAARSVIAAMVRSAGRCNKGVEVLYVVVFEDYMCLGLRVLRGPKQADLSVSRLQYVMHCQMCEERVFLPNSHAPVESPYSLLPCQCQAKTPGKTAVLLGPVWAGPIFSVPFLSKMLEVAQTLQPSPQLTSNLTALLTEAQGGLSDPLTSNPKQVNPPPVQPSSDNGPQTQKDSEGANGHPSGKQASSPGEDGDAGGGADRGMEGVVEELSVESGAEEKRGKRQWEEEEEAGEGKDGRDAQPKKRIKVESGPDSDTATCPPFYYNLQTQKLKNTTLPRLSQLTTMLRAGGFQVCRTHFDPCALRTNATLAHLLHIVLKGTVPSSSNTSVTTS